MITSVIPLLEQLRLHHAAAVLPTWLERAAHEELSYAAFLQGVLEEEAAARAHAETQRRLRKAGFPFAATIEQFDFRFRPELKRQVVLRYLDPTCVEQGGSLDRKSTRLNSSHANISYAVFCLKKKRTG